MSMLGARVRRQRERLSGHVRQWQWAGVAHHALRWGRLRVAGADMKDEIVVVVVATTDAHLPLMHGPADPQHAVPAENFLPAAAGLGHGRQGDGTFVQPCAGAGRRARASPARNEMTSQIPR